MMGRKVEGNFFVREPVSEDGTGVVVDCAGMLRIGVRGSNFTVQALTAEGGSDVGAAANVTDGSSWDVDWRWVRVTAATSGWFCVV